MEKKKNKKTLWIITAAAIVLAAAVGIFFWKFTFAAGRLFPRNAEIIDLRGSEIAEKDLEAIKEKFPEAHIYWDITIGDKTFDGDSTDIVTADFTKEDISSFQRLTELQSIDASACTSADTALALRDALPNVNVYWKVNLGGESILSGSESASIENASADEIRTAAAYLPEMKSLTLTDSTLTCDEQLSLTEEFPDISFYWNVTLEGKTFANNETNLDFSGIPLDENALSEIEKYLPCFPYAESVNFTGCGLPDETIKAFADRHDGITAAWETQLFGVTFSTTAEEIDFTDIPLTVEDAAEIEAMLPYMPNLQKVIMCRCGIENEDMETINLRHENVQFVWMIQIYSYGVRTDQTYFTVYNCDYYYENRIESAENLRYCHDMIAMDLGHLRRYGDTSFFSQMPHLRYLILTQTSHASIPELADCKELEYLEAGVSYMSDLTPLLGCPKLTDLNIVSKRTKGEGVQESDMKVLSQMKQLKRLYIGGNMYNSDQIQFLRDSLPDTTIVVNYSAETSEYGWRDAEIYFEMRDAMHMYYMNGAGDMVLVNPYTGKRSEYEDTNPF